MDPVVLDHGSSTVKAGYANPDADPSVLLPSSFCLSPSSLPSPGIDKSSVKVPLEKDVLHVLDGGRISNWDVMEDTWQYLLYDQLGWEEGNEGPLFVAEPILTPKVDRETMAQVMFEKFNVSGFFAMEAPVLSLYSLGRLSGCCVDVGHTKTDIAIVSDGALVPASACRWEAGGWDVEVLLGRLLAQSNPANEHTLAHPEEQPADWGVLRQAKEQLCCLVEDPDTLDTQIREKEPQRFCLPDGQAVEVSGECLLAGEALFRPSRVGQEGHGIVQLTLQSLADSASAMTGATQDSERMKGLVESVALVGGTSCMTGFGERFLWELGAALPPSLRPAIMKPPEYMPENTVRYSTWIGGAIVSKLVFSQNQHVSRGEYDEKGPAVVSKKLI